MENGQNLNYQASRLSANKETPTSFHSDFTLDLEDLSEIKFDENLNSEIKDSTLSFSILKELGIEGQESEKMKMEESFDLNRANFKNKSKNMRKGFSYKLKEGIQNIKTRYERTVSKKRYDSRETVKPQKKKNFTQKSVTKLKGRTPSRKKESIISKEKAEIDKVKNKSNSISNKLKNEQKSCLQSLITNIQRDKNKNSIAEIQAEMRKKEKIKNEISLKDELNFCPNLNIASLKNSRIQFVTPKVRRDMQLELMSGRNANSQYNNKSIFNSVHSEYYTPTCRLNKEKIRENNSKSIFSPKGISHFEIKEKNNQKEKQKKPRKGFFFSMKKETRNPSLVKLENSGERNINFMETQKLKTAASLSNMINGLKKFQNPHTEKEKSEIRSKDKVKFENYYSKKKAENLGNFGRKMMKGSGSRRKIGVSRNQSRKEIGRYQIKTLNEVLSNSVVADAKFEE